MHLLEGLVPEHSNESNSGLISSYNAMQSSYERIVLNRVNVKTNVKSPKRTNKNESKNDHGVDNPFQGTIICHAWYTENSNVLAIASTTKPSSVFICSISIEEDSSDQIKSKVHVLHCLDDCHGTSSILSLDWAPQKEPAKATTSTLSLDDTAANGTNGTIVTCGEDCRVFIWKYDIKFGSWQSSPVLLTNSFDTAPLCCKWNGTGDKVAIAMGGNHRTSSLQIIQCHETQEWIAREVGRREVKSSLLCVAWRPKTDGELGGGQVVASGGCDYRCRLFNVSDEDGDESEKRRFGKQVAEIITEDKSWVTTISWSLSGQKLAFATYSSQVYVVDCICLERGEGVQRTLLPILVLKESLPLCCLIFSTDSMLLASGFDGTLISFDISARSTHNDRGSEEKDSRKKNVIPLKYCASSKNPPIGQGNISCLQKHSSRYTNAGKGSSSFISASGSHGYFSLIRL